MCDNPPRDCVKFSVNRNPSFSPSFLELYSAKYVILLKPFHKYGAQYLSQYTDVVFSHQPSKSVRIKLWDK